MQNDDLAKMEKYRAKFSAKRDLSLVDAPDTMYADAPESGTKLGSKEFVGALRRRLPLVIGLGIVGLSAGYVADSLETPSYHAVASVNLTTTSDETVHFKDDASREQTSSLDSQMAILRSRTLMNNVVSKLAQEPHPSFHYERSRLGKALDSWKLPGWRPSTPPGYQGILRRTGRTLKVRQTGSGGLLEISCDSPDARAAADYLNTLVSEFAREDMDSRWKTAQDSNVWLTRQLDELKVKLERSEARMLEYAKTSGLLAFDGPDSAPGPSSLSSLENGLTQSQMDRVAKRSKYESALAVPSDSAASPLDDDLVHSYEKELGDLNRQMAELRGSFTPAYYKVRNLQSQITEIEKAIHDRRQVALQGLHSEYEEASRHTSLLEKAYRGQSAAASQLSEKAIQYNLLKREVEADRQLYETVLQQGKQRAVTMGLRASSAHLIDPAVPPGSPVRPTPFQFSAGGLLVGLSLGCGFVFVREMGTAKVRAPGETRAQLRVRELGVIPSAEYERKLQRNGLYKLIPVGRGGKGATERLTLPNLRARDTMFAESFRVALTSIIHATALNTGPQTESFVLALTSPLPGDGKSTVTANLAIAFAQMGKRVLMIDADLRNPTLHSIFGIQNIRGLQDLLRDTDRQVQNGLETYLQDTTVERLKLMTSGRPSADGTLLLHSERLQSSLERLRWDFDMILIDTSPVLATADARILGRLSNGVVVVLRSGKTGREDAQAAVALLNEDGNQVIGTILNDWNPEAVGYGYYKPHYYTAHGDDLSSSEKTSS